MLLDPDYNQRQQKTPGAKLPAFASDRLPPEMMMTIPYGTVAASVAGPDKNRAAADDSCWGSGLAGLGHCKRQSQDQTEQTITKCTKHGTPPFFTCTNHLFPSD
jgi:hypothetical protein